MYKIKLGVIGCGDIAFRSYLPAIQRLAHMVELTAVCDIVATRADRAKAQYGARAAFADAEEMLASAELDGVLVLTDMRSHGPLSLAALEAGKHVYVEKVMATDLPQADRMIRLASERGTVLACAPSTVLLSAFQWVKKVVESGQVGRITFAHAFAGHHGPARWKEYTSDPTWFYLPGAGPLFDLAVYPVHIFAQILGPIRRVSAFSGLAVKELAMTAEPVRGKILRPAVDDTAVVLLDFGDTVFATIDVSYNLLAARFAQMQFFGTCGSVTAPQFLGDEVGIWRQDSREWNVQRLPATEYDELGVAAGLLHWVDCIREGKEPINNARHARHVLEALLACYRSAETGQAVTLQVHC
jgi:predicted dehydrogenase